MRIGEFELRDPVPELRRPIAIAMLRPWIDVGRVGTLSLNILQRHLGAQELGRLVEPGKFFDFTRYRPRMRTVNGQRVFTTPNTIIHHAHDDATDRDYIFLHIREPHAFGEVYCRSISDVLSHFDVREYCRIGGMYDSVPHTRPLLVTGTMNDDQAAKAAGLVSQRRSTYQGPTSIVNMVADLVTQGEIPTTSLMAHLPQYMQLDEDHMGAARIVEILTAMFDLPASLADRERGRRQYEDVNRAVEKNERKKKKKKKK
jgi:proteasome assembly chaperone (PAC2) family protein